MELDSSSPFRAAGTNAAASTPALDLMRRLGRSPRWLRKSAARAAAWMMLRHVEDFSEAISVNLALCFASMDEDERAEFARRNAREMAMCMIDRFRIWEWNAAQVAARIRLAGVERLRDLMGKKPVIVMCPHFVGLEAAAQRLALEGRMMTLYRPSPSPEFDALRNAARARFNDQWLVRVGAPLRPVLRELQRGTPLFLLPDVDPLDTSASFASFFGVPTAIARTTAWLAMHADAAVLPMDVQRRADDTYDCRLYDALSFKGDLDADTATVMRAVDRLVAGSPVHYAWAQPRFLTRPPGESPVYSAGLIHRVRASAGAPEAL